MLRFAIFVFLAASAAGFAQDSAKPASIPPVAADSPAPPVSQQVVAAEAAIVKSDWKTAEAVLTPWLADHPNDARALFAAGYVADSQDRLDDAADLYRRAVQANPQSFEAHLALGLLLARQKEPDEARPELVAATKLDPGEGGPELKARAWRALARVDQDSDPAEASNDLLEALKISPETPSDTLLAASIAEQAGQDQEAEAAYRRVLAKDPKSEAANTGVAHILIARKQFPEAETMLRAALDQLPGDPALSAQLAAVLAAQNKAEALPLLKKLHQDRPEEPAITRMLAEVEAEAGDFAGSEALYSGLLAANPNDHVLVAAHGENLVHLNRYPEAVKTFQKATELDPTDGEAWGGLAFAALRTNQTSIALNALATRSKYLQETPGTYFLWATSYDMVHDKAEATKYYHRFLDSAAGKFPNQEWQARQRLLLLENKK